MAIYIYNEIEPPFEREHEYTYTWNDQVLTIPRNWKYFLETKGAGSNSGAWGLATAYFNLREWDKLAVMVWQKGWTNSTTYGFGGKSNYSSGGGWAGLTGFFTGETTITATDSARALIIGWGAGGTIKAGDGGAGWGTTGANGYSASWYGTAGWGGTQTGRGTWGNAGASQFNGWNGSGTYGAWWGWGRRWGNWSAWDSSSADDKGAGWGSGYISSAGTDGTNTQGGWSAKNTDGRAKITFIEDWTPPVPITWIGHIPSKEEFEDVKSIMDWLNLPLSSYKTKLHIPLSWELDSGDTHYMNKDYRAYLRYSTPKTWRAYNLRIDGNNWTITSITIDADSNKAECYNVRLFLDEYIEPDSTRTVEAWTLWGAWIFHHDVLWVISLTNWSDKNITMYDKNVGATTVYNDWDSQTITNVGRFFQRWNYYWFGYWVSPADRDPFAVDTTWYGSGNPYSSNTFHTIASWQDTWLSPSNDHLWDDSKEEYFVIE